MTCDSCLPSAAKAGVTGYDLRTKQEDRAPMPDTYCRKCNEPWDTAEVYPAAAGDTNCAMTQEEAKKFLAGDGCPSCRWGIGRQLPCPACAGFGKLARGGRWATCEYCDGSGKDDPSNPNWAILHEKTRKELNLQPGQIGF